MAKVPDAVADFLALLLQRVPEFQHQHDEHVRDNDGVLPYVLLDDFSRFILDHLGTNRSDPQPDDVACRSIETLNDAEKLQHNDLSLLIHTTFCETVETLWDEKARFRAIYDRLIPSLQRAIRTFDS